MNPFKTFDKTLNLYIDEKAIKELPLRWSEYHRHYHNVNHLLDILQEIEHNIWFKELNVLDKHALLLAAFFHDIIYKPLEKDNEDKSIKYFINHYKSNNRELRDKVCELIETTKYRKRPIAHLSEIFWEADNAQFKKSFDTYVKVERNIRKEFNEVPREKYKNGRLEFLQSCIGLFGATADKNLLKMMEWVERTY